MTRHITDVKIEAEKRKGEKKMGRLNLTISDNLDKEMRDYLQKNNITMTTFMHLAITKYLESQANAKEWQNFFTDLLKEELKK